MMKKMKLIFVLCTALIITACGGNEYDKLLKEYEVAANQYMELCKKFAKGDMALGGEVAALGEKISAMGMAIGEKHMKKPMSQSQYEKFDAINEKMVEVATASIKQLAPTLH